MRSSISHGSLICLVMRVQNRDCVSSGTIQKIREMLEKKNFPWQKVTAFVPTDIQYIWDTWFEKASFGTKGSPNDEGLRKIAEDKSNLCAFKFNDEFYCKVNFVLSEKKARMRKKEFKKIIQMAIGMASLHRASLDAKKTKHQFYCASMCIENRQQSWKRIQHINVFPSSVRLSRRDAQPSIKSTTVHRTLLGAPSDVSLSMALHWCRPEFSAVDGIGRQDGLSFGGDLVLAFGYIDESGGLHICGSGVMIAPGLLITATHVAEETFRKVGVAIAFVAPGHMRVWSLVDVHNYVKRIGPMIGIHGRTIASDVALVSCEPFSTNAADFDLNMACLEVCVPKLGERLWAVGYRQDNRDDGSPSLVMYCSSGKVIGHMFQGRGSHLPNPCIEVAMNTLGGMSGGPVFNESGKLIGTVSTSYNDPDSRGPTFVSLIWPALASEVRVTWPKEYWPSGYGGLQVQPNGKPPEPNGSVTLNEHGGLSVRFASNNLNEEIDRLGVDRNLIFAPGSSYLAEPVSDYINEFLENEGTSLLERYDRLALLLAMKQVNLVDVLYNFKKVKAHCHEGMEDLSVVSVRKTGQDLFSMEVTFNIRRVSLSFYMLDYDYQENAQAIERAAIFYDIESDGKFSNITCIVRPHYRAYFTYNSALEECSELSALVVSMQSRPQWRSLFRVN